jgi:hypothetical protein
LIQLPSRYDLHTGLRQAVSIASLVLPQKISVAVERRARGFEEARKLERADGVIVSFGKSGRTWLRVLISRYYAKKFGLADGRMMEFDDFHRSNNAIPCLFFTHDNYLKDHVGGDGKFANYGRSRVVLLVRDPRDIAVSQYFQWKHRMRMRKKIINGYPLVDEGPYKFVAGAEAGVPKIVAFMNAWARDIGKFKGLLVVKYEELRAGTQGELRRILEFLGEHPADAELDDCASFASIDNMRRMEEESAGKLTGGNRLKPGDVGEPQSFKVRRGKVGGWRDYMSEEEAAHIDRLVRETLDPVFGYT